ncbi:MAG: hypothetical protein AAGD07_09795 [Planctomycetota bacterium]
MKRLIDLLLGKTPRERIANVITYATVGALIGVSMELKWALKSPNPAEWNTYSRASNDFLYEGLNPAQPTPTPVVSHRGGNVPGIADAAPIHRLQTNYDRGQRLFELDLAWTSDDEIVVKHDWKDHRVIPSMQAFLQEAPEDHANLAMVYDWLADHPDAFIVTDCKKRSLEGVAKIRMERPDLVPQFIPQIYQLKDYELVESQGFRNIILTLYRCLPDEPAEKLIPFLEQNRLFALTIPRSRANDVALLTACDRINLPTYVHTINQPEQAMDLLVPSTDGAKVYGIYSDDLTNRDMFRIALDKSDMSR